MSLSYGLAADREGHYLTFPLTETPSPEKLGDDWMIIPTGIRRDVLMQVCNILERRPALQEGDIDPKNVLPRGRLPQTMLELRLLIAQVEARVFIT